MTVFQVAEFWRVKAGSFRARQNSEDCQRNLRVRSFVPMKKIIFSVVALLFAFNSHADWDKKSSWQSEFQARLGRKVEIKFEGVTQYEGKSAQVFDKICNGVKQKIGDSKPETLNWIKSRLATIRFVESKKFKNDVEATGKNGELLVQFNPALIEGMPRGSIGSDAGNAIEDLIEDDRFRDNLAYQIKSKMKDFLERYKFSVALAIDEASLKGKSHDEKSKLQSAMSDGYDAVQKIAAYDKGVPIAKAKIKKVLVVAHNPEGVELKGGVLILNVPMADPKSSWYPNPSIIDRLVPLLGLKSIEDIY